MPDNETNYRYVFQTDFDPKGVQAATKGIGAFSGMMAGLNKQMSKSDFSQAFKQLGDFKGLSMGLSAVGSDIAHSMGRAAEATAGLEGELAKIDVGLTGLHEQFKEGLISKAAYKQSLAAFKVMRSELRGMTEAQYAQRAAQHDALASQQKEMANAAAELKGMVISQDTLNKAMAAGDVSAQGLFKQMSNFERQAMGMDDVTKAAQLFSTVIQGQQRVMESTAGTAEKLSDAMTFKGAFKNADRELTRAVVQPFKDAYAWAIKVPTRLVEGLKTGISEAFSPGGFVTGMVTGAFKRVFSKKTLWRTALAGPLGFLSGVLSKPKDQQGKEQQGFVSGGDIGGPLGALNKALGSFGGMFKMITRTLSPMYLLMKALAPVFQTLELALRPLIAPLQKLLSDAVMQFVPFIGQLSDVVLDLMKELTPVIKEIVDALGPVLVELAKAILPPLVKIMKMAAWWIKNVTVVILKKMIPVFKAIADKVASLAETFVNVFGWLGEQLLKIPLIGWALKKLGFSGEMFASMKEYGSDEEGKGQDQAGRGMATSGMQAMATDAHLRGFGAGGASESSDLSWRDATGRGITMQAAMPVPAQMTDTTVREQQAMQKVLKQYEPLLNKQDPEEMSEPVVRALKRMTDMLLGNLPRRIGEQTKSVSLTDFSAVSF